MTDEETRALNAKATSEGLAAPTGTSGVAIDPPEAITAGPSEGKAMPAGGRFIPIAVASALFMDLMDSSALATALPSLSRAFHTDPFVLKFALTAYMITVAVLVPASGWLSDRIGMKNTFMAAMAVFVIGSVCCGLSNTVEQLIAARILQGIGGSMMTPVGRSIVVASAPRGDLVKALAWFTLPAILGPLAGPPLAGLILEFGNWRWIFFINIPFGILGLLVVARMVPRTPRGETRRFDFLGFLLIGTAIISVMVLIETVGVSGVPVWLRVGVLATAIIAGILYYRRSARPDAVVDLRLMRRDSLSVSLFASWLQRLSLGATPYLLPLLLQSAMSLSPLVASQIMTAMTVGSVTARFLLPPIIRALGFRNAALILAGTNALMSALPALFELGTPISLMMVMMAAASLTRGCFFILTQTLAYADVEPHEVSHASILFTVAQQLSYGMGVTLGAGLLQLSANGPTLSISDFQMPFLVVAGVAGLSVLVIWPLRTDAGENMRGQREAAL